MEKECWKNIENGNVAAYSEMYVYYYKKLYNYGRKFTDNIALIEDAIQVVFITLWNKREKLTLIHSPQCYIFSSFRNHILKEKKTLPGISFLNEENQSAFEFGIDNILINKETTVELNKRLQQAFESLTPRQREAIFLRFYETLSFEEIAQVMNISTKATYKLMARSLVKMKELLDISLILLLVICIGLFFSVL